MNKYKAKKEVRKIGKDVYYFDSKAEAIYFDKLVNMLRQGKISKLKIQPSFIIANSYKIHTTRTKSGKSKIGELKYTPDFSYIKDDKLVVVEVKGKKTTDYVIRFKMFLAIAYKKYNVSKFIEVINGIECIYYCDTVCTI